jgi:hypothetical protein
MKMKNKAVLRWVVFIVDCIAFPWAFYQLSADWPKVAMYIGFCVFNAIIINELNFEKVKSNFEFGIKK